MAQSSDSPTLMDVSGLEHLAGASIAIVRTEWNEAIVAALKKGCEHVAASVDAVISHDIVVPGAVEIPFACKALFESAAQKGEAPEAIITLGAVIRGGTPHFDYVCKSITEGITRLNLFLPVPVIFGVLTLDNEEQAWERLGGPHGPQGRRDLRSGIEDDCAEPVF